MLINSDFLEIKNFFKKFKGIIRYIFVYMKTSEIQVK